MPSSSTGTFENWLMQEWSTRLSQVIEMMTGESPIVSIQSNPAQVDGEMLWWEQPFTAGAGTTAWIGAPETSWKEIGGRVLSAAGGEASGIDDIQSTYKEVLNQALSGLSQSLTGRLRREVLCKAGADGPAPDRSLPSFTVEVGIADLKLSLHVVFSTELVHVLETKDKPVPERKAAPKGENLVKDAVVGGPAKTLELLLDVELPVSVSFGRAQLPLRDVIKLTTGSIVELNRAVSEPVEVIVNNCVIAKGQVVVVEGNFAVRIQQVISRQDRLRTLK